MQASRRIVEALALTAEMCGAELSPAAARMFAGELAKYPEAAVLKALERARREITGRLSLAAIIQRIDDGRPTADEAWGQVGTDDENLTFVTTDEAMRAWGQARMLIDQGDMVAARMAFRDAYNRIVTEARATGTPARPHVSLGHDKASRARVLMEAVQAGRLDADHAANLLGVPAAELTGQSRPVLPAGQARPVAQLVGQIVKRSGPPPCGAEDCDGWTHGENGPRCPQWGGEGR
jgi:hypothetical protein